MTARETLRDQELRLQGWERRFTVEARRVPEYVELYASLGLETLVEPLSAADAQREECRPCYETIGQFFKVIYTRPKSGAPSPPSENDLDSLFPSGTT